MLEKLPVLVTAISSYGLQILKALNLANNGMYTIIGADIGDNCRYPNLVDQYVKLPLVSDPLYIDELLNACNQHDVKALFCGCEPELKTVSVNRSVFLNKGIFLPINSQRVLSTCMNKKKTFENLKALGFNVPDMYGTKFPMIVKPSTNSGGSSNTYIVQDKTELFGIMEYLGLNRSIDDFLIQEYVGTPEEEYTVGVLMDMNGEYVNSIAVKRLLSTKLNVHTSVRNRTSRKELGEQLVISSGISHGYVGRFPVVTEQCKKIAMALGSVGPINIQCRLVDDVVRVFEINPRFSGTTYIRAMVGYNEPDVLIRKHIFGEHIDVNFEYNEKLILRDIVERTA
jgi:carbamoyl-phosphate synthase large subunit